MVVSVRELDSHEVIQNWPRVRTIDGRWLGVSPQRLLG